MEYVHPILFFIQYILNKDSLFKSFVGYLILHRLSFEYGMKFPTLCLTWERWMGSRAQSTICCFPELCFLLFFRGTCACGVAKAIYELHYLSHLIGPVLILIIIITMISLVNNYLNCILVFNCVSVQGADNTYCRLRI